MSSISSRLARLESSRGSDQERWLHSLSEEQIEARIADLDMSLRSQLEAEGIDCTGLSSRDVCAVVGQFEKNDGHRPAVLENNLEIS